MRHGSRHEAKVLLGLFKFSQLRTLAATLACLAIAALIAFLPEHEGLSPAGHRALFVLVFAAGLWVSEAIPAFATSLLAIGCLITLLGRPDGVYAEGPKDWEQFIRPWGSPLIWLFFGGFCLAASAEKTGLDRWLAARALGFFGDRPAMLLLGVMIVTAVLSMFVSNTATATLVLAMLTPVFAAREPGHVMTKALALGVAFAANLGGMGTIIGTPPNAIAAGLLVGSSEVNFAEWMVLAVPPALLLLAIAWSYLVVIYLRTTGFQRGEAIEFPAISAAQQPPRLRQLIVVATFFATVGLWVTSPLHGLPTTVVSFLPIVALTATGVLSSEEIRKLPWDILLLITGGLSLGVAMDKTGLAAWAVGLLPVEGMTPFALAIGFGYATIVMSNLMSNTATANLVLPITIAVLSALPATGGDSRLAVAIALAASTAMCLPISTPPNAIVYGAGYMKTRDLACGGIVIGLIAPPIMAGWVWLALQWL